MCVHGYRRDRMKKRIFAFLGLLCISLLFVTCGRSSDAVEDCNVEASDAKCDVDERHEAAEYDANNGYNNVTDVYLEIEDGMQMLTYIPRSEFTTEHFLEDLDYMLYVMCNNFGLFDVAYWARGVNIYAMFEMVRDDVLSNPDMTVDEFYNVLHQHFLPLEPIGHFQVMPPWMHNFILNEPEGGVFRGYYSIRAQARLREPHVMAFYEPLYYVAGEHSIWLDAVTQLFGITEQEMMEQRTYNRLLMRGEYKMADDFLQAMLASDLSEIMRLESYINEALSNIVTTRILEDGHIAYLAIDSFFFRGGFPPDEERKIHNFYEEIRYFDHLIIDLRFNGGGGVGFFHELVLEPNLSRTHVMEGFAFLTNGEIAMQYAQRIRLMTPLSPSIGEPRSMDTGLRPIAEILEAYDLPDLNIADMERMVYGFRTETTVRPRRHYPRMCIEPSFQGKIWFLTSPSMASGALLSAWTARETGFATLVGDITGGRYGGVTTIFNMPNSGIAITMDIYYVTDRNGRPLEAGTIPDIFNHEGMNALETVLALIAAWEY